MFRRSAALFSILLLCLAASPALAKPSTPASRSNDVVLVLPFENTSGQREFNWIGESFADILSELLGSHGLSVVPSDAREIAYQRLRLPLTVIPSRATAIKLAREAGATLLVLGTYEVSPAHDEKTVAAVRGSSRVIRVNEGRLTGKEQKDGRWASHEFTFGDALVNLQTVQGRLAYQILYEHDDKLPFSQKGIIEQATKVPAKAFEGLVKATMTDDREKRTNYLKNAMNEFAKANPGGIYLQAAFELGHLHLYHKDYAKADEHFSMLQKKDPHYAEAAFYAGLSRWKLGNFHGALDALLPLTSDMPLTSVYNNAGAIATQAASVEKDGNKREGLLKQATSVLGRAVESAPEDPLLRYNYGYALMLAGKPAEAAEQFRAVINQNARDPQALFLLAKSLEKSGQAEAATANDNDARKYFRGYAEAQIEWEKSQTISRIPLRLRGDFNRAEALAAIQDEERDKATTTDTQNLLAKAQELYSAGRDDEALTELRDVVRIEPMNATAYLLTGRIYQRRGEHALAINQLKTSLFWDAKLIDAHILLGRIFLERGDRNQAMSHAREAMQIDSNNQEAIALQRQVQTGIK
jgi:predicted Zn-dependent protease